MESLWRKQINDYELQPEIKSSDAESIHWDVIVIGAGMAGLLIWTYGNRQRF